MGKTLIVYEKKENKLDSNDIIELDSSNLEKFSNFRTFPEFLQIPSTKINNKTILEWFSYNDISYWWFLVPVLTGKHYEGTSFVDRFLGVIEYYKPKKIIVRGYFDKLDIISEICSKNKIKLHFSKIDVIQFNLRQFLKNTTKKYRYSVITKNKCKSRLDIFQKNKNFSLPKSDYVLITSHQSYLRKFFDPVSGITKEQEFITQPILDMLTENNIPKLCIDLDYTLKGRTDVLLHRLISNHNWIPVEFFLQNKKSKNTKIIIEKISKSIQNLISNDLSNIFQHRNISLWKFIKPVFEEILLEPHIPTYVHLMNELEEFLKNHKPKKIVQVYETGTFAKCFEFIGQKLAIHTIGIQHGNMVGDQVDYMYKEIKNEKFPLGNPIPSKTFVFGEYHKDFLTKKIGCYPPDQITVIGNPSFYHIEELKKHLHKEELIKKMNLPNKKIILVPLSYKFGYQNFRERDSILLDKIYETFKNNSEIIVLVRPHPGDKFTQDDLDRLYPSTNFKCSKLSLAEDLTLCDLVMITFSSVGLDATLFEKPIIFVQISDINESDSIQNIRNLLVENGLAKFIHLEDVIEVLSSIKKGEKWEIDSFKRQKFLELFTNYGKIPDFKKLIYD